MSREHFYKAKRKNWREFPKEEWWVEGALFEEKENSYIFTNIKTADRWENSEIGGYVTGYLVDSKTICEYTGLTDKNSSKILRMIFSILEIKIYHILLNGMIQDLWERQ